MAKAVAFFLLINSPSVPESTVELIKNTPVPPGWCLAGLGWHKISAPPAPLHLPHWLHWPQGSGWNTWAGPELLIGEAPFRWYGRDPKGPYGAARRWWRIAADQRAGR